MYFFVADFGSKFLLSYAQRSVGLLLWETLIKAFPSPDLRCEAAFSLANPCDPPNGAERRCESAKRAAIRVS